jgi:hypothetical protein
LGLQKHIEKEIAKLDIAVVSPEQWTRTVGKKEAYEKVLELIKELNALEVVERQENYE